MAHGFFKALRAQHLSSTSVKNSRCLVGMIQRTLNRLNIAVLLEKIYSVDFPEAVRRHVLVETEHLRRPLDIFPNRLPCAVSFPASTGERPHFPGLPEDRRPQRLRQTDHAPLFRFLFRDPKAGLNLLRFEIEHVPHPEPGV